jgi:hypothetical protein
LPKRLTVSRDRVRDIRGIVHEESAAWWPRCSPTQYSVFDLVISAATSEDEVGPITCVWCIVDAKKTPEKEK